MHTDEMQDAFDNNSFDRLLTKGSLNLFDKNSMHSEIPFKATKRRPSAAIFCISPLDLGFAG